MPNQIVRPGPIHVVPLLTARSTKIVSKEYKIRGKTIKWKLRPGSSDQFVTRNKDNKHQYISYISHLTNIPTREACSMTLKFPIAGKHIHYYGNDQRKKRRAEQFNAQSEMIEIYINSELSKGARGIFSYALIGIETGIDSKIVAEVLRHINGGDTGFTIPHNFMAKDIKSDITSSQGWRRE